LAVVRSRSWAVVLLPVLKAVVVLMLVLATALTPVQAMVLEPTHHKTLQKE